MSMTRRQLLTSSLAAGTALTIPTVTACESSPSKAPKLRTLRYVTGFVGPREFYMYVGKRLGIFGKLGIDLVITPGNPATSVNSVAHGQADLADADFTSVIQLLAPPKGDPLAGVRIVGITQPKTPFGVIVPTSSGITSPKDLEGKKLSCARGSAGQRLLPLYAKLAGFNAAKVTVKPVETASQVADVIPGHSADGIITYLLDLPTLQAAARAELSVLPYANYMTDVEGTVWLARSDLATSDPDLVGRAVGGLYQSMQYCLNNPKAAAALLARDVPDTKVKLAAQVYEGMKPWAGKGPGVDYAHMHRAFAILASGGLIDPAVTPEKIVTKVLPGAVQV
jgi:NitT/TauT family transport system substrate-binding protein